MKLVAEAYVVKGNLAATLESIRYINKSSVIRYVKVPRSYQPSNLSERNGTKEFTETARTKSYAWDENRKVHLPMHWLKARDNELYSHRCNQVSSERQCTCTKYKKAQNWLTNNDTNYLPDIDHPSQSITYKGLPVNKPSLPSISLIAADKLHQDCHQKYVGFNTYILSADFYLQAKPGN